MQCVEKEENDVRSSGTVVTVSYDLLDGCSVLNSSSQEEEQPVFLQLIYHFISLIKILINTSMELKLIVWIKHFEVQIWYIPKLEGRFCLHCYPYWLVLIFMSMWQHKYYSYLHVSFFLTKGA